MLKRIWILFKARNLEFLRDRSALAWNILFPVLIIVGFSLVFGDKRQILYKAGIIGNGAAASEDRMKDFQKTRYVDFISFKSPDQALDKLLHHRIDIVVNPGEEKFWTSRTSPKGYIAERLLKASSVKGEPVFKKQSITGVEIPYIEWLFPGVLGMNIMFSALFGVGYVVVTYRKNGVLKRMSVTPLRPLEFLTSQVLSRMYLLLLTTAVVFVGCKLMYGFQVRGSYLALILIFCMGGISMISLALVVASRSGSEEFAGGVLNMISWPMMFLSEVWFSLEGAEPWVIRLSRVFPLTQMVEAMRKIMNDGAGLADVRSNLIILAATTLLCLTSGSLLFKWQKG